MLTAPAVTMLRDCLIAPALPPALDGIGDHSSRLAFALQTAGADVVVLGPNAAVVDPVAGVRVVAAFWPAERGSVWDDSGQH